ncbi:hypothetical protein [Cellulomonas marina]|uniref:Uncharacterized protein n=1 Tax=Cellulomonas marina TaxID=988821 RepID=A0A1I0X6R9_9CELL|nr:hypothetical protein [Cellulomonas marina]GIG29467.1 hypothetical protein Cma02nite_20670 [Cellulomonas marina]SFA96544.1 hypothetical protein SAMN05421867_104162 [Cellulomonas marina]
MRSLRILLALVLTAVGAVVVLRPSAPDDRTGVGSAVLASTFPPQYAMGRPRAADGVPMAATVRDSTWDLAVGGPDPWTLSITPPVGRDVEVGRYAGVGTVPTAGRAGARLVVDDQEVPFAGDLDVLAWDVDPAGRLVRWDVVLRTPDTTTVGAFFGQQRAGPAGPQAERADAEEHAAASPVSLAGTHLHWPSTPVGSVPVVAPELVRNVSSAPVALGAATLTGPHRDDWQVTEDGCSGRVLPAGGTCVLLLGFSPTTAGPRTAALTVTAPTGPVTADLAGEAPPGVTTLVVTRDDGLGQGRLHRWVEGGTTALVARRPAPGVVAFSTGSPYRLSPEAGAATLTVGGGRPRLGPSHTGTDLTQRWARVTLDGRGWPLVVGRQTVRRFDVDRAGTVLAADLDVVLHDPAAPHRTLHAQLRFRDRDDLRAPAPPTGLTLVEVGGTRTVTWAPSASGDLAATVARLVPGDGDDAAPTSGLPLAAGRTPSTVLPALPADEQWTVVVFAVDTAGNVSPGSRLPVG